MGRNMHMVGGHTPVEMAGLRPQWYLISVNGHWLSTSGHLPFTVQDIFF